MKELCEYHEQGMMCSGSRDCDGRNLNCPMYTPRGHLDGFAEMFNVVTPRQAILRNGLERFYDKWGQDYMTTDSRSSANQGGRQ